MSGFVPSEKATTVRMPSTANLMISSVNRNNGIFATAGDFTITKTANLMNGYFTRVGVTEIVLEWNVPNIYNDISSCAVDINGVGTVTVALPIGLYTCADALNTFITLFNIASPARPLAITSTGGTVTLAMTGGTFRFPLAGNANSFITLIGFPVGGGYVASQTISTSPTLPQSRGQLTRYDYIDFTSNDLTYNQDLKDTNTGITVYDVLQRWYMAYTNDMNQVDSLGFPIYMGYKPFMVRREFNPPKQIKWDTNMPIGNLRFQVFASTGGQTTTLLNTLGYDWYMTLQVSEV